MIKIMHHMYKNNLNQRMNWIRAGVLGANDGIVSISALLVGVAGATSPKHAIITAGTAGLIAGALSMAVGEYVSVSSQRDTEETVLKKRRRDLTNPLQAALASAISFTAGAIIPLAAVLLAPSTWGIVATFSASLVALLVTGSVSGYLSGASMVHATLRIVIGGALAMAITLGIGLMIGQSNI